MEQIILFVLQQHLPFTVLKLKEDQQIGISFVKVATALTVYGIETYNEPTLTRSLYIPVATALTVYGIETNLFRFRNIGN